MVKKTASSIVKILTSFFIAFLLILSIAFFFLKEGIEIEHIKFPYININKLYLKLDKKFILKIDNLNIKKEKEANREKDIENYIKSFKYLPKLFQEIDIKKVSFLNYHVTFFYSDKIYFIDTDKYQFAALIDIKDHKIHADIPLFFYKDFNFYAKGKSLIDLKTGYASFLGKYNLEGIKGDIRLKLIEDKIDFFINSLYFKNENLKNITEKFDLNQEIKNWIYRYIVAKKYKLEYLKGKIDLNAKNLYNPKSIEALAYAYNAKIEFNPKAKVVKTDKIRVIFKNDSLYFKLLKPKYENKDLDGSYVVIKNLTKSGSYIDVIIKTKSPIDKEIKDLLLAYDIELPITQEKGFTDAVVKINVIFKTNRVDVEGLFSTKDSILNIAGVPLDIKSAKIKLKNNKLTILNSYVGLKNFVTSKAIGDIYFDKKYADINLSNLNANFIFNNTNILSIKDYNEKLFIDFKNKEFTKLDLKNLKTDIFIYKNRYEIVLKDLNRLKKYSKLLKELDIKNGNLKIETKDFKKYRVLGKIEKDNKIVADKNGKFIKIFNVKGEISPQKISFLINKKIKLIYKKYPTIYIDGYDIYLTKKYFKNRKTDNLKKFDVFGKNSNIIIDGHKVLSQNYSFIYRDEVFEFKNRYKKGIVTLKGKTSHFNIKAQNLNDEFVKSFFNLYGIIGGKYHLYADGNMDKLKGKVKIYNSTLKDLALINNIMAFLNTIPALVTFSDPGYSTKGFKVKKGEILFRLEDSLLYIDDLKLKGKSLNIDGLGYINLKENTINMRLTLQTWKKVTDIIKKIPVAGYILLGEEGKISTVLKIEGDLIKPKISSKLPEETIKAPVNIIKRTLQLPFKIFE